MSVANTVSFLGPEEAYHILHCIMCQKLRRSLRMRPQEDINEQCYLLSMLQNVSTVLMALLIGVGGSLMHTITPRGKLHTTRPYRFPALVA